MVSALITKYSDSKRLCRILLPALRATFLPEEGSLRSPIFYIPRTAVCVNSQQLKNTRISRIRVLRRFRETSPTPKIRVFGVFGV